MFAKIFIFIIMITDKIFLKGMSHNNQEKCQPFLC